MIMDGRVKGRTVSTTRGTRVRMHATAAPVDGVQVWEVRLTATVPSVRGGKPVPVVSPRLLGTVRALGGRAGAWVLLESAASPWTAVESLTHAGRLFGQLVELGLL